MMASIIQSLAAIHDLIKTVKQLLEYARGPQADPGNRTYYALIARLESLVRICEGVQ